MNPFESVKQSIRLARLISLHRVKTNLTLEELENYTGIPKSTLDAISLGHRNLLELDSPSLIALCHTLDISIAELYEAYTENPSKHSQDALLELIKEMQSNIKLLTRREYNFIYSILHTIHRYIILRIKNRLPSKKNSSPPIPYSQ